MASTKIVKNICINGDAGKLEAIFNPVEKPKFLAVVCHPHPLYQGTMHNKVVVHAAKALASLGGAVLRFNFRGVMASDGAYDNGNGEEQDVKSAVNFLVNEYSADEVPLFVVGFSFGAWVGLKYGAHDDRVQFLIGLGLPLRMFSVEKFMKSTKPKLLIWGDSDELCPMDDVNQLVRSLSEPKEVRIVAKADHFFTGQLQGMTSFLEDWVKQRILQ
ncbi:conserved hypothetical protein [Chloroherpeton thalassium ATCC 35110]|uniref:KANL3/Tex30 alpha/beta hydrolase-like domain-containing protein n=1 Tax=Chloroherpeton thalassium (strain ATCC 35110 / GB-78) TaxID=517418 RepID=B3QW94_CHLT3|nr:alpha/beta family hydrolase [Chloroherpeton thalassium]ACF13207.1 conserved hypothetical protein [Chloroherpeton thalassium ATCC 35110]